MKNCLLVILLLLVFFGGAQAQDSDTASERQWDFNADANFYFFTDDFIFVPVFKADKNKLHLEARYNYEDLETFSGWVGYNFSGGDKFTYTITPMLGGVVGNSNGIAPGLEFTFGLEGFEWYAESEYVFDVETSENNFYYMWSDITYSPTDWLWVGISGQRTRLYQTDLEVQRGLIVGGGYKSIELTGYLYNFDIDDPFFLVTLSVGF